MSNNTRLHFIHDGMWEIWLDTDIGKRDGLCVACHTNLEKAKQKALKELKNAIKVLEQKDKKC